MGIIAQRDLFTVFRNSLINLLKHGYKFLHESISFLVDLLSMKRHLFLPYLQQFQVRFLLHFQQRVALLKSLVIVVERIYISMVVLGNHHIHQTPAFLTSSLNKEGITGRNENQRNEANMLRQPLILFLVTLEVLFRSPLHSATDG